MYVYWGAMSTTWRIVLGAMQVVMVPGLADVKSLSWSYDRYLTEADDDGLKSSR
jgi:hypothetical protein